MRCHSSAKSSHVDPDPSGVRLGSDEPDPDEDRYIGDDDEPAEGSVFGDDEDAALNRVWSIFARKSIEDGHGTDLKAIHARKYEGVRRNRSFYFGRGAA